MQGLKNTLHALPPARGLIVGTISSLEIFRRKGETQAKINGYSILRRRALERKLELKRQLSESEFSFAEVERHTRQVGCPWIYLNSLHLEFEIPIEENPFLEQNREKPQQSPVDTDKPLTQ